MIICKYKKYYAKLFKWNAWSTFYNFFRKDHHFKEIHAENYSKKRYGRGVIFISMLIDEGGWGETTDTISR